MGSKPLCGDQASCVCIRHQSRPSLLVCYLNFVHRGLSGGLRQAGVAADRKPTFNLLTPAFCRILQAAGAKTVFGRQLILTREIYIEAYLNLNIWDFCLTNSEDQRLNGSLDRYFIIQRQKLGKYVGNYRGNRRRILDLLQISADPSSPDTNWRGKTSQTWQTSNLYIHTAYFRYPQLSKYFDRRSPTRGVSVPYFQAKCHFVLSNVTVEAKTIFLTQQRSPNLAAQVENWYLDKQKCFIWHFLSLSSLQHFRLMLETENRKIYIRNCGPGNAELHFIISRSVYCLAEFCG